ncbi:MAG: hypothetical protein GX202_09150 [Firmicutes bacterium]|nr:hypothetical protein [Bacillota bacterium]
MSMTSEEFIQKLLSTLAYNTVYMWGTFGSPVTKKIIEEKAEQYPSWYTEERKEFLYGLIGQNYFAFDCAGLIKGILWGWNGDPAQKYGGAKYKANGVPDLSADALIARCNPSTDFSRVVPGEVVWISGHVGTYLGEGKVIESTSAWKNGVQITGCLNVLHDPQLPSGRLWTKHGKLPYVDYGGKD